MTFSGKATFSAGTGLPELVEDVSDIIGIVSPFETPLLDHLGDPQRVATSTNHEWLEDALLANISAVDDQSIADGLTDTSFDMADGSLFAIGDQIQVEGSREVMLVTGLSDNTVSVTRGYGGTVAESVSDGDVVRILGNAALEGASKTDARFSNRVRVNNYTQIFTKTVEVSGSQLAAQQIGIDDELDYQKQERLRELVRDLENCVINGVAPVADGQGSTTVRRTMKGIHSFIASNVFQPGVGGFPQGDGGSNDLLNEELLNTAMREIWEQSNGHVDTIVVNGYQKRRINSLISSARAFGSREQTYSDLVSVYESDFGVCRVVMSRWVAADTVMLLDSSRISVLPLAGRSFHFKKLASSGDSEIGQVIGEYTLEMRNENAHGVIRGLGAA